MSTSEETGDRRERIAKVIARAGLCSRREAEEWIVAGRVAINGTLLETPAHTVGEGDHVTVDGVPLPDREPTRLWLYHKPRGLVTTNSDPEGRPTVFEHLPEDLPRVMTIGRLDINTEGLLLLTNDGGLARVLELPATGWLRRYRVRAHGDVTQADLDKLKEGVAVDGVLYGPVEATLDRVQGANAWLMIGIREGKNREVKQVLGTVGLEVSRLIRISFGPFQLADLEPGEVREIRGRILRDQLGDRLADEAGCVFATGNDAEPRPAKPRKTSVRTAAASAAADKPRPSRARPLAGDGPGRSDTGDRPARPPRAAAAGRRAGDRPLSGGGDGPRMVSRGSRSHDEGRSRGTRSHDGEGRGDRPRPARPANPANPNPRVLAPQDWTGEYASEGPAPVKQERPPRSSAGPKGAGARGDGPRGPRSAGSRADGPRSAGSRGDAPGAEERPKVIRPPRGHSVWRADDAGGRPMREPRDPNAAPRPPRDAAERPVRDRPVRERPARSFGDGPPRADGDRPMQRRRPDAEVTGWSPPQGPVTATDKPSRRMAARARDAATLGDDAPARPSRDRPSSGDRTPYAGRPRSDERPAPRGRGDFADRPPRRSADGPARPPRRTTVEGAERPVRAPRAGGDRPYTPRPPRAEGERTYKPRAPRAEGDRPARAPRADGERTYKPRAPRAEGDRPARAPRAEGERTYKPRAPRAEGERTYTPRPPRAEGERTYKPRPPRADGDRPARAPRAEGERTYTPRAPRAEGERSYTPRPPRAEGERTYKPRPPRADGDRPARPPRADGDRPARPPRAGGPAGAGRPAGSGRPGGKPSFGGDRPRPSGPPKGRPAGSTRGGGPKGSGPKGGPRSGGPKGRPAGGAPRGRPRDGQ
jgi:23S rRNA pseudouridine2605 synthase